MSATPDARQPILYLWGAKGGVGTSTLAAVIALHAARQRPVELRATTPERLDELAVLLGVTHTPGATLTLGGDDSDDHLVIIDGGTDPTPPEAATASLLVNSEPATGRCATPPPVRQASSWWRSRSVHSMPGTSRTSSASRCWPPSRWRRQWPGRSTPGSFSSAPPPVPDRRRPGFGRAVCERRVAIMSTPETIGHCADPEPAPPPLGTCRFCGDDTWGADDAGPVHPCCAIHTFENPGQPCIACAAPARSVGAATRWACTTSTLTRCASSAAAHPATTRPPPDQFPDSTP